MNNHISNVSEQNFSGFAPIIFAGTRIRTSIKAMGLLSFSQIFEILFINCQLRFYPKLVVV
jgi:hypothetical protein